jgi:hypothetical protein
VLSLANDCNREAPSSCCCRKTAVCSCCECSSSPSKATPFAICYPHFQHHICNPSSNLVEAVVCLAPFLSKYSRYGVPHSLFGLEEGYYFYRSACRRAGKHRCHFLPAGEMEMSSAYCCCCFAVRAIPNSPLLRSRSKWNEKVSLS